MTTQAFLDILKSNPNLPLYFEYRAGEFVRSDYHITEIKNVSYDTVDCGGVQNTWEETIVQLWENETPEPEHSVNTDRALKIFEVVEKTRPTFKTTDLKFEYGNSTFHTAIMPVQSIDITDKIIVKLANEHTTCKAKDRKAENSLQELELACTPGGGCC